MLASCLGSARCERKELEGKRQGHTSSKEGDELPPGGNNQVLHETATPPPFCTILKTHGSLTAAHSTLLKQC